MASQITRPQSMWFLFMGLSLVEGLEHTKKILDELKTNIEREIKLITKEDLKRVFFN